MLAQQENTPALVWTRLTCVHGSSSRDLPLGRLFHDLTRQSKSALAHARAQSASNTGQTRDERISINARGGGAPRTEEVVVEGGLGRSDQGKQRPLLADWR